MRVLVTGGAEFIGANLMHLAAARPPVVESVEQPAVWHEANSTTPRWRTQRPTACRRSLLRLFNVYGPLQSADYADAAVVPAFVSAVPGHRPVGIYGDVRPSQADDRRLRELFPDIPPNDFAGGLAATVDWVKSSPR